MDNNFYIYQYGDFEKLDMKLNVNVMLKDLEMFEDDWNQYIPYKPHIQRFGLCVMNDRGETGPGPALTSMWEYNRINGTNLSEKDFIIPTEVYENSEELRRFLGPIKEHICRTHFLKFPPGGFFPAHRDHRGKEQDTFRIIVPIHNCNPEGFVFLLEDKVLNWEMGRAYILNTTKPHTLFNCSVSVDSIFLVINAFSDDFMVDFVSRNLYVK